MANSTLLSNISKWLNFSLELEETIAAKVPVANIGKAGNVLSVIFLDTSIAEQFITQLSAPSTATPATMPTTPAAS